MGLPLTSNTTLFFDFKIHNGQARLDSYFSKSNYEIFKNQMIYKKQGNKQIKLINLIKKSIFIG